MIRNKLPWQSVRINLSVILCWEVAWSPDSKLGGYEDGEWCGSGMKTENYENKARKANDASSWWWNDCTMTGLLESLDYSRLPLAVIRVDIHSQIDLAMDCLIEMLSYI